MTESDAGATKATVASHGRPVDNAGGRQSGTDARDRVVAPPLAPPR